jgi:hypothetical protein
MKALKPGAEPHRAASERTAMVKTVRILFIQALPNLKTTPQVIYNLDVYWVYICVKRVFFICVIYMRESVAVSGWKEQRDHAARG